MLQGKNINDLITEMKQNPYDKYDVNFYNNDVLPDIVLFTIPDNQKRCKIHKKDYKELFFRCVVDGFPLFGYKTVFCEECNKLFISQSNDYIIDKLSQRGVKYRYYNIVETNACVKSEIKVCELSVKDTLYIPEILIDDNPVCPVHSCKLDEQPYIYKYKSKEIIFDGFYCEECSKVVISKAKAIELANECQASGIKILSTDSLVPSQPEIKKIIPHKAKPNYFVNNGVIKDFGHSNSKIIVNLDEQDTVVVSKTAHCNYNGHNTERIMGMFIVMTRRDGNKRYAYSGGYCSKCQKYYMNESDYKAIYRKGRPCITIINDVADNEYHITSGEIYHIEKNKLASTVGIIQKSIDDIKASPDWIDPMYKGIDYIDISGLSIKKKMSDEKYGKTLDRLYDWIKKPYSYRVDIYNKDKTETFYVGTKDIVIDGTRHVISFNHPLGKQLINYRTINVNYKGVKYSIKLSREFDIEDSKLFGYVNLRSAEDIVFRNGITDPFLIKVLKLRKQQHNLVDIMVTIQDNQNAIVDADINKNIIVQGCAGSGKTMVMLHRLSSLKYNHEEKFNEDNILILTPNSQFNLHISGLAEGLQIGNIKRISVHEYFAELLEKYSDEFLNTKKIISEVAVNQILVNYIYSDEFLDTFFQKYDIVLSEFKVIKELIENVAQEINVTSLTFRSDNDAVFIDSLISNYNKCYRIIDDKKKELIDINKKLHDIKDLSEPLLDRLHYYNEENQTIIERILPGFNAKIRKLLSELKRTISQDNVQIGKLELEANQINEQISIDMSDRLSEIRKKIKVLKTQRTKAENRYDEVNRLFNIGIEGKNDEQINAWMKQFIPYIKEVRDDVFTIENIRKNYIHYRERCNDMALKLKTLNEEREIAIKTQYSNELLKKIHRIKEMVSSLSAKKIFDKIFNLSISDFLNEKKVKMPIGIHRYDLYIRLWFCKKYYGKNPGTARYICVDEAQDVAYNTYRLIYEVNNSKVIWNLYGDTNQLLKPGRGVDSWNQLVNKYNMDIFYLNENYRNTNQITRFCNDSFGMTVAQTGVDGPSVREIIRKDLEGEICSLNVGSERIAILIPRVVKKSDYINIGLLTEEIRNTISSNIGNGKITYAYVDEVKGIEFDKVYVVPNGMKRNEKYIAYTRALYDLIIVFDEKIEGNTVMIDEDAETEMETES